MEVSKLGVLSDSPGMMDLRTLSKMLEGGYSRVVPSSPASPSPG